METNVKYRIVKSGKNYAIQKWMPYSWSTRTNLRESYFKKSDRTWHCYGKIEWRFFSIEDHAANNSEDIHNVSTNPFSPVWVRLYKTKKAAQDALKKHLWDAMVEPINGQEEWKQVNKD